MPKVYTMAESSINDQRFDEVLTKTSWVIFGTPCMYLNRLTR